MSAELAYGGRVAVRLHAAARMPCRGRGGAGAMTTALYAGDGCA